MNEKKKKSIRPVIYLALVAVIAVAVSVTVVSTKKENVTTDVIMGKIENASELTSAKMICTGLKHYSDGKIPFLTEEAFSMTYSATVRAGIDMDKLDVKVTHSKVIIKVPEVEIQDINIDDDSIQFYDKKFALFSGDAKEDVIAARKEIKKDVQEKVEVQELKKTAKTQIEVLLKSLFEDSIGDRELEIRFEE
ncbi:DUF4230 domain-containing protein [Faecalicatena contorta]|uniref:DUF4230 domain-containing protein n=1 Tax=Faecalicatena contorta TaxID=39482 RepID=UPI001F1889E2|nr:DUF4230 domain-containing protein [Faecalicatena contorta]MCF2679325.1 DUF4230 domain-containing protein [Faecalicatena contorta]